MLVNATPSEVSTFVSSTPASKVRTFRPEPFLTKLISAMKAASENVLPAFSWKSLSWPVRTMLPAKTGAANSEAERASAVPSVESFMCLYSLVDKWTRGGPPASFKHQPYQEHKLLIQLTFFQNKYLDTDNM